MTSRGDFLAGVADACGTVLMLARTPWDRVKPEPAACTTG
jgi:hypothetical protein